VVNYALGLVLINVKLPLKYYSRPFIQPAVVIARDRKILTVTLFEDSHAFLHPRSFATLFFVHAQFLSCYILSTLAWIQKKSNSAAQNFFS